MTLTPAAALAASHSAMYDCLSSGGGCATPSWFRTLLYSLSDVVASRPATPHDAGTCMHQLLVGGHPSRTLGRIVY